MSFNVGLALVRSIFPSTVAAHRGAEPSYVTYLNLTPAFSSMTAGKIWLFVLGVAPTVISPGRFLASVKNSSQSFHGVLALAVNTEGVAAVRHLRRVAIVANSEHPGSQIERAYTEDFGRKLGLTIQYLPTRSRDELINAFTAMAADPPQAISVFADGFAVQNRQSIIDFAMSHRMPVISGWPVFARSGALCTYGPRLTESYKRLADYVDRILRGAKPSTLPIEQPTKFEMVLNQRTAKALGLTIPSTLLVSADEVID